MASKLEHLSKLSRISADTADLNFFEEFAVHDATTNPSLILAAAKTETFKEIIAKVKADFGATPIPYQIERLLVEAGSQILEKIPGQVSTEIDAHYSYSIDDTLQQAKRIIEFYEQKRIPRERVLIKIAATWQGIQAARLLENEGIATNLTLIFNFTQALACAEAGITLISPFVGRILDWFKNNEPENDWSGKNDPGVNSVGQIYRHFKAHEYTTQVLAASFRNTDEIERLAGCDLLTIAPKFLSQLAQETSEINTNINDLEAPSTLDKETPTESGFYWDMNESPSATFLLTDGIRRFAKDQRLLADLISLQDK